MKYCDTCHVYVQTDDNTCPLCQATIVSSDGPNYRVPVNHYPNFTKQIKQYNFILRLLLFISLFGCAVSVLINLLTSSHFLWCLIVVACVGYGWAVVPDLIKRGTNFALQAVLQAFLSSTLCILLDFIIGYNGWSVNFVVPSILIVCILSIDLLSLFNRTNFAQYILYSVFVGILGFIPLVLYLTGISNVLILAIIPACLGFASVLGCLIFSDKTLKSEFKRRFHF